MTLDNADKVLVVLDSLRKALELSRAEVLWMATTRNVAIAACEEVIKTQALEIEKLRLDAVKGFPGMSDTRTTQWIHELTQTIVQQREDLVTARLDRERLSVECANSNDRVLELLESLFGKV